MELLEGYSYKNKCFSKKLSKNKTSGNDKISPLIGKNIEIGMKKDHIPLYMVIPPKYAVNKAAETIKKNTGRSLNRRFAFLEKVYCDRKDLWGRGYFFSTVGLNGEVILRYIQSFDHIEEMIFKISQNIARRVFEKFLPI